MFDNASDSTINNGFGGSVHITTDSHLGKAEQAYVVIFDSIPKAACVTMATTDWGGDAGSGFAYMSVDGSDDEATASGATLASTLPSAQVTEGAFYAIPGAKDANLASPMNVVTATQACASDTNNVFVWKYI
jgi:hypothetical protein